MIRKLVCAGVVMVIAVAIVAAEESSGIATNIDAKAGTFTFQATKKGEKVGDAKKMKLAKDGVVAKGVQDKEDKKKIVKGDAIEGGLGNKLFADAGEKGVAVRVTFEGENASQVLVVGKKKKDAK
jgi:hypothetical protein